MKLKKAVRNTLISGMLLTASPIPIYARENQNDIEFDPLFEYPMAPEGLDGLNAKSNNLVDHFWDPMDFKT